MLFLTVIAVGRAHAEADEIELYNGYKFALGVGAAIVKFDKKWAPGDAELME